MVSRQKQGSSLFTLSTPPDFHTSLKKCVLLYHLYFSKEFQDLFQEIFVERVKHRLSPEHRMGKIKVTVDMDLLHTDEVVVKRIVLTCPSSETEVKKDLLRIFEPEPDVMFNQCFMETMYRFILSDKWPVFTYIFEIMTKIKFTYTVHPLHAKGITDGIRTEISNHCGSERKYTLVAVHLHPTSHDITNIKLQFMQYTPSLREFLLNTTIVEFDVLLSKIVTTVVLNYVPQNIPTSVFSVSNADFEFSKRLSSPFSILQYSILRENSKKLSSFILSSIHDQVPELDVTRLYVTVDASDSENPPILKIRYPADVIESLNRLDYTTMVNSYFEQNRIHHPTKKISVEFQLNPDRSKDYFVKTKNIKELKSALTEQLKKISPTTFEIVDIKKSNGFYIDSIKLLLFHHQNKKSFQHLSYPELRGIVRNAVKNLSTASASASAPASAPASAVKMTDQQLQDLFRPPSLMSFMSSSSKKKKPMSKMVVDTEEKSKSAAPVVSAAADPLQSSKSIQKSSSKVDSSESVKDQKMWFTPYSPSPRVVILSRQDIASLQQRSPDTRRDHAIQSVLPMLHHNCQILSTQEPFKDLLTHWKIMVVGSQELGTALPESDIDLQIVSLVGMDNGSKGGKRDKESDDIKNIPREKQDEMLEALRSLLLGSSDDLKEMEIRKVKSKDRKHTPSLLIFKYQGYTFELSFATTYTNPTEVYRKLKQRIQHMDKKADGGVSVSSLVVALKRFYLSHPEWMELMKREGLSSIALTIMVLVYLDSMTKEGKRYPRKLLNALNGFMAFYRAFQPKTHKIDYTMNLVPKTKLERQSEISASQYRDDSAYPLVVQDPAQRLQKDHTTLVNFTKRVREWANLLPLFHFIFVDESIETPEEEAFFDMSLQDIRSHVLQMPNHRAAKTAFIRKVVERNIPNSPKKNIEKLHRYLHFLCHVLQTILGIYPIDLVDKVVQKIYQLYSSFGPGYGPTILVLTNIDRRLSDRDLYERLQDSDASPFLMAAAAHSKDSSQNRGRLYLLFSNGDQALHFLLKPSPVFPHKELLLPPWSEHPEFSKIFNGKTPRMFTHWTKDSSSSSSSSWFGNGL